MNYSEERPIDEVVKLAGSQTKLALALGVSQQAVSIWVRRGWVPHERARELESLYGVPRKSLIDPRLIDIVSPDVEFEEIHD